MTDIVSRYGFGTGIEEQVAMTDIKTMGCSTVDAQHWHDRAIAAEAEIERLQAVVREFLAWNARNGGYGELPPLLRAAEAAIEPLSTHEGDART